MTKIPCTVGVLTFNSAASLPRALASVADFADVVVCDGGSTDDTRAIAESAGARVIVQDQKYKNPNNTVADFSGVRNQMLEAAREQWFLFIDSDEYLSTEAVDEIRGIVEKGEEAPYKVYRLPRIYVVDGEVIGRSSMYPNYQTRFFYRPAVTEFKKKVHERIQPKPGVETGTLIHPEYVPFEPWPVLAAKWRRYAIQQIVGKPVPRSQLVSFTFSNLLIFAKYCIKYLLTFVRGTGKRMPLMYEWHNAKYHILLVLFAWQTAYTKKI